MVSLTYAVKEIYFVGKSKTAPSLKKAKQKVEKDGKKKFMAFKYNNQESKANNLPKVFIQINWQQRLTTDYQQPR